MRRVMLSGWGVLLALLFCFGGRPAEAATLSGELQSLLSLSPLQSQRVIVQTQGTPTGSLLNLVKLLGGQVYAVFDTVDGFAARLSVPLIGTLLNRLDVVHISPDLPITGSVDLSNAAVGSAAARERTGLDGRGIGVAVLDTGVAPHAELTRPTSRIVAWRDLVNGRSSPYDDSGHGTHVAGTIAGNGSVAASVGSDLRGVAPGASIIGVKILDSQMRGYASTAIKGLDFCVANARTYNIRVVNLSLGQPVRESYRKDPLCKAVARVWQRGLVVVVSAGNLGRVNPADPASGTRYGTVTAPGNEPLALTVGATRTSGTPELTDDAVATYSSRGPTALDHVVKPDLVAPGNRVLSLGCDGALAARFPGDAVTLGGARYLRLSGTSMAAPVVAGTVALLLQADPRLSPDTVKLRLMHTARKQWSPAAASARPYDRGAGLVHVMGALQSREDAVWAARSPSLQRDTASGLFRRSGTSALWGELNGETAAWYDDPEDPTYYSEPPPCGETYEPPSYPPDSSGEYWNGYQPPPTHPDSSSPPPPGTAADEAQILWGEPSLWADSVHWSDEPDGRTDGLSGTLIADP